MDTPPRMAGRLAAYGSSSIFDEMGALAARYNAIDLSSGSPDVPVPDAVLNAARDAIAAGRNGYSPVAGDIVLRRAIAAHVERFYDRRLDPLTEVTVTSGVSEGLHSALASFIEPGDEVVVFEPCYDAYVPGIRLAGGTPVPVLLRPPDFRLDAAELSAAFSPRTKALLLNNPHNPTGKVFSRDELTEIAEMCQRFDVLALTDEVYEHIVFDGRKHLRLPDLPGMWERTLTLSGASKTFASPGWRIGWATGPAPLHQALNTFRQYNAFCASTPLQIGVASGLALPGRYFADLAAEFEARRDILLEQLAATSFQTFPPGGGFFTLASFPPDEFANGRDCCHALARDAGVVPIPLDSFYLDPRRAEQIVRFAFCQRRERLIEAGSRLTQARPAEV